MRYLLDTCTASELVRDRPDPGVAQWIQSQDDADVGMSVLTVGELEKGVLKLPPSAKRERLVRWLRDDVKARFAERLLGLDLEAAETWARMRAEAEGVGRPPPVIDSLIAATAISRDCAVVTRNVEDMERCGARVVCPWSG